MTIQAGQLTQLLEQINGGEAARALPELDRLLKEHPTHPSALTLRAEALRTLGRAPEAIEAYQRAGESGAGARNWLVAGVMLAADRKTDEALKCLLKALAETPNDEQVLDTLVTSLFNSNRQREAIEFARHQLAIGTNPRYLANAALLLQGVDLYEEASNAFKKILELVPDDPSIVGGALGPARFTCEWEWIESLQRRIGAWYDAGDFGAPQEYPLTHLTWCSDEARNFGVTRAYAERTVPKVEPYTPQVTPRPGRRIRVGYLSCDFRNHATMHLLAGLLESHDRGRFEVFAYDYSSFDISDYRQRFLNSVEHHVEIHSLSDREAAARIAADELDILFDLKVYTGGCRSGILAHRPAPLQVAYLGFPGSAANAYIDYIIADRFVTPDSSAPYYTEKFCRLPHTYQCNDRKRFTAPEPGTRAMYGLPADKVVFGAFNQSYKIDRASFAVWLRVLAEVPDSVLWLLGQSEITIAHLTRHAQLGGVDPARLIFAPFAAPRDHLTRLQVADAILDTLACNGHTTTSDALWAGVPVITCRGKHFASRVSESLLNAIELPELVGVDHDDMVRIAKRIGTDADYRATLRNKVDRNRLTAPLFDTERFTRNFETALEMMVEQHRSGVALTHIDVPDGGPIAPRAAAPLREDKPMSDVAELMLQLPAGGQRKFFYRADSIGDQGVIQQIFHAADYQIVPDSRYQTLVRYANAQAAAGKRPLVIDAGANIGASSVYFALQYSSGRVIAIEPEKGNAELARRNCEGLNVVVREAALGSEPGTAFLTDPGHSDWGFRVGETGEHLVPVVTIPEILGAADVGEFAPLICKIDIEGGEVGLFAKNSDWVDAFPLIIIELHDWLFPGEGSSRNFLRAIASHNFDFIWRGENAFCFNNRLLKDV
jgi:protein O-GlcNAc transferase